MQCYLPAANLSMNTPSGLQIPQATSHIGYPTTILPIRPLGLMQQITVIFQLSQEALNHLSNQMNEIAVKNRLIKRDVSNTRNSQMCKIRVPRKPQLT